MFECVQSCWGLPVHVSGVGQQGATTVSTAPNNEDLDSIIHGAILSALTNLEFTGATREGFHAYWPFADAPGLYTVPIGRKENLWIDLMVNTNTTSCLAVMSPQCFEYYFEDYRGTYACICAGQEYQKSHELIGRLRCPSDLHRQSREYGEDEQSKELLNNHRSFRKPTFLQTHIRLNPSTPVEHVIQRDKLGKVLLEEKAKIAMGELGTLEIIRADHDRGVHLAKLKTGKIEKLLSTLERALVHKECIDFHGDPGDLVDLCVT